MLNRQLLPTKGLTTAAVHATLLLAILLAIGHPTDQLAVTTATLYAIFRVSIEIIASSTLWILKQLTKVAEETSLNLGTDLTHHLPPNPSIPAKFITALIILLLHSATTGITLIAGIFLISQAGLHPLPNHLTWLSIALTLTGTTGLAFIYSLLTAVVLAMAHMADAVNPKFDQLRLLAQTVDTRLRAKIPN